MVNTFMSVVLVSIKSSHFDANMSINILLVMSLMNKKVEGYNERKTSCHKY